MRLELNDFFFTSGLKKTSGGYKYASMFVVFRVGHLFNVAGTLLMYNFWTSLGPASPLKWEDALNVIRRDEIEQTLH